MTTSESPTHPDAPRAGGETPMIDPKRIAADAVQRLSDSEPDEDAIAAMDRLAGTPQESMFCVSAPVLERVIEVAVADALFDASRVSLLERHRDGERAEIGLPPDESPQRNAVCDALTEALLYLGNLAYEADERTMLDLRDETDMRGLVRLLTVRDAKGRDGSLGENTRNLWARIGKALASAPPSPERASK